jgi:hypothetical protein
VKLVRSITYAPHKWLSKDIKVHANQQLRALREEARIVVIEEGTDNIFFDGSLWLFNQCLQRGHFHEVVS